MGYRKYTADDNFFETIDNENKAYWLGFIYADGYVSIHKNSNSKVLEIGLSSKDINHLRKFQKDIKTDNPVRLKNNNSCRISIVSAKIFDDLAKYGIVPNKSLVAIPPNDSLIPEDLKHHFIRGIFDGDGGFTTGDKYKTYSVAFCGTIATCEYVLDFFNKNITIGIKKGTTNFGQFKIKGNNQARKVADQLYKDATIYLDRKFEIYQELIQLNKELAVKKEVATQNFLDKSEIIINKLKEGMTGRQIAKELQCRDTNLIRYVRDYRSEEKNKKEKIVLDLFDSGIQNKSEINRITGFSRDYIRKVLSK